MFYLNEINITLYKLIEPIITKTAKKQSKS